MIIRLGKKIQEKPYGVWGGGGGIHQPPSPLVRPRVKGQFVEFQFKHRSEMYAALMLFKIIRGGRLSYFLR